MCTFCFREKETLEHVLYEYVKVQKFLSTVYSRFFEFFIFNIVILFGEHNKQNLLIFPNLNGIKKFWESLVYIHANGSFLNIDIGGIF